jgi:glyoxylase I family protein
MSNAPTFPTITHVAVTVSDLSVSVPWYQRLVGAEPVIDEDTGPFHHVVFPVGDALLGLHRFPDGPVGGAFDERQRGLDHIAFACADRTELQKWAARLDELGIARGEITDAHYGSAVSFRDPDNIALEFFAPPS